eukprot:scaffold16668_cov119-Isochrysis_galbana.AAC.3
MHALGTPAGRRGWVRGGSVGRGGGGFRRGVEVGASVARTPHKERGGGNPLKFPPLAELPLELVSETRSARPGQET